MLFGLISFRGRQGFLFFVFSSAVSYWSSWLCCHERPHSNPTSHPDSTELPGEHKSPQTATDVK